MLPSGRYNQSANTKAARIVPRIPAATPKRAAKMAIKMTNASGTSARPEDRLKITLARSAAVAHSPAPVVVSSKECILGENLFIASAEQHAVSPHKLGWHKTELRRENSRAPGSG